MNKAKWDAMPPDVKKVFDDLRREQAEWTGKYVDNHVKEALAWSKEKYKHELLKFSAADQAEIAKAVKPMIDEYVKKVTGQGLPGEQIVAELQKLKEKYEKQYK
jgi:TRAP-type C4-dicarboxylate transport system substrate-binding protein